MLAVAYTQNLNPTGSAILSTIVAALPVLTLFYLLVARRWLANWAGASGAIVAILIAWLLYEMPLGMASWAFVHGAFFGLLPIGWTVFAAMLLYNLTVETGQFTIIRRSIGSLSGDARVQSVLIGFCFGAFMEGAAGAGSPVAICGAMLVGLGVPPFRAAVICLIANTSPVAYGGLGVPILTLGSTSGINPDTLSIMAGHQLPIMSCLIPLYMVRCMCSWRDTFAIWPALVVGGGSFALFQFTFATFHAYVPSVVLWPLTDIGGGLFSLATLALFLKFVWKPKDEWRFRADVAGSGQTVPNPSDPQEKAGEEQAESLLPTGRGMAERQQPLTAAKVILAWSPWLIMAACLVAAGLLRQLEKSEPITVAGVQSYYIQDVPTLHNEVERAERLRKRDVPPEENWEAAQFKFNWLTAPGTPVFVAVLISFFVLRTSWSTIRATFRRTFIQMKVPIPTIAFMLGLSYVTKYAGIDATLGVAFAETGVFYPFFAAILGWLGVFLTGTDAGSNALFGSLQKITAGEVYRTGVITHLTQGQTETLICTANSTGGVMGKMIDAQSICVATAGTNQIGKEADIFKAVIGHSIILASIVGLLTALQAFVVPFTWMVPHP